MLKITSSIKVVLGWFLKLIKPRRNSNHLKKHKLEQITTPITVLFSDIRNFSNLSKLYEPYVLTQVMTKFNIEMLKIIEDYQGIFTYPKSHGAIAAWYETNGGESQAINCALTMINSITSLNNILKNDGLPIINIGVGVATGLVKNGTIINLTDFTRYLTNKSAFYKHSLIISENIATNLINEFITIELDRIYDLENKSIPIYTIIGTSKSILREHLLICRSQHSKFLREYRDRHWDIAITIATGLKSAWNNKLKDFYLIMIDNCKLFRDHPPAENWNDRYKIDI